MIAAAWISARSRSRQAIILLWACICFPALLPAQAPIQLTDVTQSTGITFKHTDGGSGRRYIIETVSAGLALLDYDLDGDLDVYFLNGAPLQGTSAAVPPRNALYRNEGQWRFVDVTEETGVGDQGFGLGVAAGDYNNDGLPDLYLNNYGPNVLLHNNGDGTFSDHTLRAGVSNGDQVGAGACFVDIENDGDLDLYVANYLDFSYDTVGPVTFRGVPVYPAPELFAPVSDVLFRNEGDGTFTDISQAAGIAAHAGQGMGTVCADYDNDGDTDIFVANDSYPNFLFQNDGRGKFQEVGLLVGIAYDKNGEDQAGMGVACGDYDNDGWLDFYVTTYQRQLATLYRNLEGVLLEDVTRLSRAGTGTYEHVSWGTEFVDFDNDGWRDIFVACGHLMDNVAQFDDTTAYEAPNILLRNAGKGQFANISNQAGDGLQVKRSSRGAAFDDLDGDGDVDGVILNSRREPTVLRNDSPGGHHWLQLELFGTRANRQAVGAQVRVVAGDLTLVDEVHSGRGYQSHYGTRLYFGLGQRARVDRVEVRWPGGAVETFDSPAVDRLSRLVEGAGQR